MNVLADTVTVLYWLTRDRRMSAFAESVFRDDSVQVWLSAASIWEAVIKSPTRGDPPLL